MITNLRVPLKDGAASSKRRLGRGWSKVKVSELTLPTWLAWAFTEPSVQRSVAPCLDRRSDT